MKDIRQWVDEIRIVHGSFRCWLLGHRWGWGDNLDYICLRCGMPIGWLPPDVEDSAPAICRRIHDAFCRLSLPLHRWIDAVKWKMRTVDDEFPF